MEPLPWKWALFVWGYALVWFLVNDRVKLLAYWILDRTEAGATPQARAQHELDAKAEAQPDAQPNATPEVNAEPKAEPPFDLTAQIAERAYDLYKRRTHGETQPDQDWLEAERDIRREESLK